MSDNSTNVDSFVTAYAGMFPKVPLEKVREIVNSYPEGHAAVLDELQNYEAIFGGDVCKSCIDGPSGNFANQHIPNQAQVADDVDDIVPFDIPEEDLDVDYPPDEEGQVPPEDEDVEPPFEEPVVQPPVEPVVQPPVEVPVVQPPVEPVVQPPVEEPVVQPPVEPQVVEEPKMDPKESIGARLKIGSKLTTILTNGPSETLPLLQDLLRDKNIEFAEFDIAGDKDMIDYVESKAAQLNVDGTWPVTMYEDLVVGGYQAVQTRLETSTLEAIVQLRPQTIEDVKNSHYNIVDYLASWTSWFSKAPVPYKLTEGQFTKMVPVVQTNWYYRHQERVLGFTHDCLHRLNAQTHECRASHLYSTIREVETFSDVYFAIKFHGGVSSEYYSCPKADLAEFVACLKEKVPDLSVVLFDVKPEQPEVKAEEKVDEKVEANNADL